MGEVKPRYVPTEQEIAYRRDWQNAFKAVGWVDWLIDEIMLNDNPQLVHAVRLVNEHGFTKAEIILISITGD